MSVRPNIKNKQRLLIVNADDFGMTKGITEGIICLYKKGIVTSTSLMIGMPGTSHAAFLTKREKGLSVGLHGQLVPRKGVKDQIGDFISQLENQLKSFIKLTSKMPSHFDLHGVPPTTSKMAFAAHMFAKKHNFAYRGMGQMRVINEFYGMKGTKMNIQNISYDFVKKVIISLRPGISVLVCHPGITSNKLSDPYRKQRNVEFSLLTSKKFYSLIREEEIKLVNFYSKEVKKLHGS